MVKTNEFRAAMARAGYSQNQLAREVGIAPSTLSLKANNKLEFRASEIAKIIKILQIDNVVEIFLS